MKVLMLLAAIVAVSFADIYMHNPPGSNNRVDDANNAPANRLFDSQNNNQAGYNSGEAGSTLQFYKGSVMTMQWTSQHGCGVNPNTHCDVIIQYRCDELMRDGTSRDQPEDNLGADDAEPSADRGRHEPYVNWVECKARERNGGLFISDQNVGNQAQNTRQNAGGGRSGYECAEERDHFPYWHLTYWKDIAVMTDNTTRCEYYQRESQNVMAKNYCSDPAYNNEVDCNQQAGDGSWMTQDAWDIDAPECVLAPWGRVNLHANAITPGAGDASHMELAHFNITTPDEVSSTCLYRLRYNISSDDYDGWEIDARYNDELSPVENDPVVTIAGTDLQMDTNSAQFFRTFQDRTHVFSILERPDGVSDKKRIYNINVRGKRGNNANTYPNVEYDFTPNRLHIKKNDLVHWQWTGSDNNPNGNDRSNVVGLEAMGMNYPLHVDETSMWETEEQAYMAGTSCGSNDPNLQDVSAYCNVGLVEYPDKGVFHYMSTKNNAYTNRAQKGSLIVGGGGVSNGLIIGLAVGGAAVVAGGAAAAMVYKNKSGGAGATRF